MSRILVVGGTGYIGKQVVRASLKQGHPTFVYGRPITPQISPAKLLIHQEFLAKGVTFLRVNIVISMLTAPQVLDQLRIIEAIRVAGNVTVSSIGVWCGRGWITPPEPFHSFLELKRRIRRVIEASGIPYTFVVGNCCAQYFLHVLFHTTDRQTDTVIYRTGEARGTEFYPAEKCAKCIFVMCSGVRPQIFGCSGSTCSEDDLVLTLIKTASFYLNPQASSF